MRAPVPYRGNLPFLVINELDVHRRRYPTGLSLEPNSLVKQTRNKSNLINHEASHRQRRRDNKGALEKREREREKNSRSSSEGESANVCGTFNQRNIGASASEMKVRR